MKCKVKFNGRFIQIFTAFLVNFHTMVYSMVAIWPASAIPSLMSDTSPLPSGKITVADASLISSILYLGGLVGTVLFGFTAKQWGQKQAILCAVVPEVCAALCITFAKDVNYLHASRFLSGVATGAIQIIPAYVSEISEDSIRGFLGSILGIVDCTALLIGAILGAYMSFFRVPYIHIVLSGISLLFIFFPESPQYLLTQKKISQAEKSLKFFRHSKSQEKIAEEFNRLQNSIVDTTKTTKESVTLKDFKKPESMRALVICAVIFTGRQASGIVTILNFSGLVFKETGMKMDPNMGTIIFAIVQLISYTIMSLYIDKLGRRIVLIGSLMGVFVSYVPIAAYFYARSTGEDVSSLATWLPLTAFSGVAVFSMGLIHTPSIIMTEIVPVKIKGMVVLIIYLITRLQSILMLQFFMPAYKKYGMHVCITAFATWTFFETLYVFFYLPETKGLSVEDIVKNLAEKKPARSKNQIQLNPDC